MSEKDGLRSRCKDCEKKARHAYYIANQERLREVAKKWGKEHPDYIKKKNIEYRKRHPGNSALYAHRMGKSRPLSEATDSGIYLGVYIAERVLSRYFESVQRMPMGNPGYDFICPKGNKIDVKCSCLNKPNRGAPLWRFHVGRNKIADYFLCLAFDDRKSLEPQHLWLVPNRATNDKTAIAIFKTDKSISKWSGFEKPIDRVASLCDIMRSEKVTA